MEIINVSSNKEKLMLSMVSMLRRLLRNALRTMKLLNVIISTRFYPMCRKPSTMFIFEA